MHTYKNNRPIYLGKTDILSAFCLVPLSKDSWSWVIMKADNPATGKTYYFIDKCLPFGASISYALFQSVSYVLKFLIEFRTKQQDKVTNYLDDFLFVAFTQMLCNYLFQEFLNLCEQIGIPISEEKTEWLAECMVFWAILLNGRFMILAIPEEKRTKAISMLSQFIEQE